MFKKIAVAFDESPEAERAFRSAMNLAQLASSEIYLVTVIENFPAFMSYVYAEAPGVPTLLKEQRRAFYIDLHNKAKTEAEHAGVPLRTALVEGDEVEALLNVLDRIQPNLLVVGLRQGQGMMGRILGGTAHRIALHAQCDILGIR